MYHFTTVDHKPLDVSITDLRHIECTTNHLGHSIYVIHLKSTGQEYQVDGNDEKTLHELALLMKNKH